MRRSSIAAAILVAVQLLIAASGFAQDAQAPLAAEPPFVICQNQRYALCAEASCFIYDGVAYCKCDIMRGDSISLQLSYTSPAGEQNVCDVNRQGRHNGYMVSTFSFPTNVEKGGHGSRLHLPGVGKRGQRGERTGGLRAVRWCGLLEEQQGPAVSRLPRQAQA